MRASSSKAGAQTRVKSQPTSARVTKSRDSVLFLKQSQAKFEPPGQNVSVFFDECNQEVISLTSGLESKTKVLFQATETLETIQFLLPIEKRILSIKLNPLRTVLAYHVEKSIVEFINVKLTKDSNESPVHVLDDRRYVQASRAKNSQLLGFLWTGPTELVMITDISIEYYHLDLQRRRLRLVKSFQSATNWFVYQPAANNSNCSESCVDDVVHHHSILMVSTGSIGNSMQPYMFQRNQIIKLQRFEVEGNWHGSDKLELFERSITVASVYGRIRLLVLQHESLNVKSRGAQILVYTVDHESGVTAKTHTLDLDVSGKFAINIFDNLVIAHDQPSKTSFIFDIRIESTEKSDCPKHFVSLIDNLPIRQLQLGDTEEDLAMYSLNWVFFQPNFIIDAKMGLLCTLHLDLAAMQKVIQDDRMLLNFLAYRKNSEEIILSKCKEMMANSFQASTDSSRVADSPLADVTATFEILSNLVVSAPDLGRKVSSDKQVPGTKISSNQEKERTVSKYSAQLSQEDVHRELFRQLDSPSMVENPSQSHFITSTLIEFIFLVRKQEKNVEFCIYEQLLKCLVRDKRYYQLIQMIRSDILSDSKQLACLLLSLRHQYKPAVQLGLDMLHRLNCLTELIESLNLNPDLEERLPSETTSRLSDALHISIEVDAN